MQKPASAPLTRRSGFINTFLGWAILGGLVLYLLLFTFNSLTRVLPFAPDSMNYVDVARNIAAGKGISQSTLGYNQAHLFDENSQAPEPLVVQPPLYPLMIAGTSRLGLSFVASALLIPAIAYAVILLIAFFLARELFGVSTAVLTTAGLLIFAPLGLFSRKAFSESPTLVFLLLSLLLSILVRRRIGTAPLGFITFLGGVAAGLAFATRYAMLLLVLLESFYLVEGFVSKKNKPYALLPYVLGAAIPIGLVFAHNLISTGRIMPASLPSDRSILYNLSDAFLSMFGTYFWMGSPIVQVIFAVLLLILSVLLLDKQDMLPKIWHRILHDGYYLLPLWVAGYYFFIVIERSLITFNKIDTRLMIPASVVLAILGIACIVRAFQLISRPVYIRAMATVLILAACGQEARFSLSQTAYSLEDRVTASQRLSWIADNTTDKDFIVGESAMEVPFYFGRASAFVGPYPLNIYLTYPGLISFADHNCSRYQHIYLILLPREDIPYDNLLYRFGQFITDIRFHQLKDYPRILPVVDLEDGRIFEISCGGISQ